MVHHALTIFASCETLARDGPLRAPRRDGEAAHRRRRAPPVVTPVDDGPRRSPPRGSPAVDGPRWTATRRSAARGGARRGDALGEVPVGAVVVARRARSSRARTTCARPTATRRRTRRCSRCARRRACSVRGASTAATLYVTLEPCFMCAGALVNARVDAARLRRARPQGRRRRLARRRRARPAPQPPPGGADAACRAEECGALLTDFFAARRGPR